MEIDTHYYTPLTTTPYVWDFGFEPKIPVCSHPSITPYKSRKSTPQGRLFGLFWGQDGGYFCISKLRWGSCTEVENPQFWAYLKPPLFGVNHIVFNSKLSGF